MLGIIKNFFYHAPRIDNVLFEDAIFTGRIISAIFTLFIVFLTYLFTRSLSNKITAIFVSIISMTSVAYLQYSHFSTFEMWLTFFTLLMVYLYYNFLKKNKDFFFILGCVVLGVLLGLKISSITLLLIPLFVILVKFLDGKINFKKGLHVLKLFFLLIYLSILFYLLASPFNTLDVNSFLSSMKYEGGVATGSLPVFYTGSFFNQIPIFFQVIFSLPFLINPLITLLLIPSIIYLTFISIRQKNIYFGLIIFSFLTIFISQSFLFAKWTRYIIPSLPYIYMMIGIAVFDLKKHVSKLTFKIILSILVITGFIFSFSFLKTVRFDQDSRLAALSFAKHNISPNSSIISEVYDLGIVPFNSTYPNILLFNFYDLDNVADMNTALVQELKNRDYIILPSQRVYKPRIVNSDKFPKGNTFYSNLFSNKTSYKKIYETPCDIYCKILYMGDPVFHVEDTVNVFDRPIVYIFKKN